MTTTTNVHGVVKIEVSNLVPLSDCSTRKFLFTMEDGTTYEVTAFGKPEDLAMSF